MQDFEKSYAELVMDVLMRGEEKQTRNGITKSVFGRTLSFDIGYYGFPLIQGRKMFYEGILGEFAAMIRKPKHINDFKKWGCNYWDLWAKEDGSIEVDYGNAWFEDGQMDHLLNCLANNPNDRRMLINGWRPHRLKDLDLPCCHYSYQFYVREGEFIDMIWNQRSVDIMIGLPSDIVFAAVWLILLSNQTGYKPGKINMMLGDCHIYNEHIPGATFYIAQTPEIFSLDIPSYDLKVEKGALMTDMEPVWFNINYESLPKINFKLKE